MKQARHSTPITADIHSMSHDGRGIATIEGKTTFITGALAFEKVICRITKRHRRYNEAEITTILTPATERVEPHCAHFHLCGGCSMQHLHIDAQIALKQKTLLEQLQHFGKVTPESILTPLIGQAWGYRRKARFGVHYNKDQKKLIVGFRKKNSNTLVNIEHCPILHSQLPIKVSDINNLINSLSQFAHIPQVELAVSDQTTALIIRHLTTLPTDDVEKINAFAKKHSLSIYLQPNAPPIFKKFGHRMIQKVLPMHCLTIRLRCYLSQLILFKSMQK